MAIGSIFAEFDLDYTKFDKNKQKLEASATATVVAMERQWDHLTDKQMDEYGRAVDFIKRKHAEILADTTKTAQEQARAYTVAADRMKAINADMSYEAEKAARANQQNADLRMAQMKAEEQGVKKFQAAMAEQRRGEEAATEKSNRQNADWWNAKRKMEDDGVREFKAAMAKQKKEEMELNNKANRENAEWWNAKRKFDADAKKAESANYDALGIKSKAYYDQKKADVTAAYRAVVASGDNEFRIQKAYKDKLAALDREYAGQSHVNMAGMVRGALALYAAYFVVSQVVGTVVNFLKSGLEVQDQMKTSAIAIAASITTAQGSPEGYKKNYEYASALVLKLREVDKVSFATYENILLMNRAMELQGVHLDMNNEKQMGTFTSLTNAVALYTAGQDQAKQAAQEFRSIFSGNIKAGSEVAKIIDTQAKASGLYKNGLADIVKHSKSHKDILEKIQPFLIGIEAAVGDISKTWESATTTLESSWNMLKAATSEALFPNAVEDIKSLARAMEDSRPSVAMWIRDFHDGVMLIWGSLVQTKNVINLLASAPFAALGMTGPFDEWAAKMDETDAAFKRMKDNTRDFRESLEGWKPFPEGGNLLEYTEVKKVTDEYGKMYTYVKGIRDTPNTGPGADAVNENLKSQTRSLAKEKEAAKDRYEEAIRHADKMEKLARLQGKWEVDNVAKTLKTKTDATHTYHSELVGFAKRETDIEQKKADASEQDFDRKEELDKRILAADSETKRALTAHKDDWSNKNEAANQSMIDNTAKAYETVNKYSEASADAQIADINRRYDRSAATVKKTLNDAARLKELSKVVPSMTVARTDDRMGVVAPDSNEYMDLFEENLRAKADLMNDQFNDQIEKESWLTTRIAEEWRKRDEAAASYYGDLEGFSGKSFLATLAVIEATRQADERKYGSEAANKKAVQATHKAIEAKFDAEHANIIKVSSATADMFGNAKALMDENSRGYAAAHNAEMAMRAIEIAVQAEKNLMIAVGAVLSQGTGDPYSAPARMAAMAAAVAGLLSIVGLGFTSMSGGGGEAANPNQYASGTGTLFGSGEASQSISNVAEILKDSHASEYARLTGIYAEIRDLNDNITGLVRGLVNVGGDFSGVGATSGTGGLKSMTGKVNDVFGGAMDKLMTSNPITAGLWKLSGGLAEKAISGIFGGDKTQSSIGQGVSISGTTMGDVLSGASGAVGQFFLDMKEVTDGGWFHSDKTKFWTTFSELDADTNRLLTLVFSNLGSTVLELADGFGVDVAAKLADYKIDLGKVDLMGKSADEINEALSSIFSAYGDKLVNDLFGNIVSQYQKINEGVLETAVRVLADQAQIEAIFQMTRITADASIELSESLIKLAGGLDSLKEAATTYYNAFFTDAEKTADRQRTLTESLSQLGYILPSTRAGFRDLVESTKAMTATNQEAYVSLLNMAGTADEYYSAMEDQQEEILNSFKSQLSSVQDALKSFTTQTSESIVASVRDITRRTRLGIAVPSDELNAALSAATSTSTAGFASGLDYDLSRARNRAALSELEDATAGWLTPGEAQLAALEKQSALLDTLTALTAQTTTALTGESGTASLLLEVKELKGLLTGNAVYVKRISDNVEEMAN